MPSLSHNWLWNDDDISPDGVETHTYYHVQRIRDWFSRDAIFDVIPVSPAGPSEDYVDAYVRDGYYCNAYAAIRGGTLYFGNGYESGGCTDLALCPDIIYHEYSHLVIQQIYDDANISIFNHDHGGAIHEGFSDYFGLSITNDSINGNGCGINRNIDANNKYPINYVNQVHVDGTIIAGALWDVRRELGQQYVDNLAFRALKHAPTSFQEYLGILLEEDDNPAYSPDPSADNDINNGSPNIGAICEQFFDIHGLYHDYCAGYTVNPVAIITTPSPLRHKQNVYDTTTSIINIEGTAQGSRNNLFSQFALEYAAETDLDTWLNAGITLTDGGASPINNNVLGQWDISSLADGYYMLRLTVTDSANNVSYAYTNILIESRYQNGWPKKLDTYFYATPAVADLDPSYPGLEIIARERWGRLNVWHADGTAMPGWPQYVPQWPVTPVSIADLDANGDFEVLAVGDNAVYIFNHDGSSFSGWPQVCSSDFDREMHPVVSDLDKDGQLDIVVGTDDGHVCAWNANGTMLSGWPVSIGTRVQLPAAIGDINNDEQLEVVIINSSGEVYVMDQNGHNLPGWPQFSGRSAMPVLADLNKNGKLEIITAGFTRVNALQHDGTLLTGWHVTLENDIYPGPSPAIADLDSDGQLDVMIMVGKKLYFWHGDGTAFASSPILLCQSICSGNNLSPIAGDIDNDGQMEALIINDFSRIGRTYEEYDLFGNRIIHKLFAFHQDGTVLPDFPIYFTSQYGAQQSPIIADIDEDGDTEIILNAFGVFVWDLPLPYSDAAIAAWPEFRRDTLRTASIPSEAPTAIELNCDGFGPPANKDLIIKSKSRTIPVKANLFDNAGIEYTNGDISPPVIEIQLNGTTLISDVFEYEDDKWKYQLRTKELSENNTYTIRLQSGNTSEYNINSNNSCTLNLRSL